MRGSSLTTPHQQLPCRIWKVIPCVGSPPYEVNAPYYDNLATQTCPHCHKANGYGVGIYLYFPSHQAAHITCVHAAEEAGIALRSNAFVVDAAARRAGLTQEGFRALAVWEKDRLIAEVQADNKEVNHG